MPELWFIVGLAVGILVTGFIAVGSFERGADSVRKAPWRLELAARHAVQARRGTVRAAAQQRIDSGDGSVMTLEVPARTLSA